MNVFRSLRDYLKFLAGGDDEPAEPAPEKKQVEPRPVVKPVQRAQSSQGDGFDAGSRRPVDLRGGMTGPVLEPDEPVSEAAPILPSDFNASLDDLALVDEPMEEQPEFIPEGGMSTQSLMQEFATLETETEPPSPRGGEGRGEGLPTPAPEPIVSAPTEAPAAEPSAERVDEPMEEQSEFIPEGGVSTQSLMQEFQTLDPALVAESIAAASIAPSVTTAEPAAPTSQLEGYPLTPSEERETGAIDSAEFATPESTFAFAPTSLAESGFESGPVETVPEAAPARPQIAHSSFEASSFTPADPSAAPPVVKPARLVPAWLIPATTAAAPKPVPSGTDFNASLDDLPEASEGDGGEGNKS